MDSDSTESGNVISFSTQKVLKNDILNSNDDSLNAVVSTYKEEDALADIIQSSHIDMAQFNTVSTYPSANKQDISQKATFLNECAETSIEELSHKNDILKKKISELLKKYSAKEEEQSKTAEQLARTLMESYKYKQEIDKLTSTCEQLQKEKVNLEIQVKHYEAQLFQYKQLAFDSKKDAGKIFELKKLKSINEKFVTKGQNLLTAAEGSNLEKLKKGIPIVTEDEEERISPSSLQNMKNENIISEQDYSLITPLKDQGYEESGSKKDNIKINQKHEKSEYKKDVIHLNQNKTTIIPKYIMKDSHVSIDHSPAKKLKTAKAIKPTSTEHREQTVENKNASNSTKKNNKSFCNDIVDNFNSFVAIGNENVFVVQEASEEETCNNLTEDLLNKHLTNTKIKEKENVRDSTLKLTNKQNKNVLAKIGNVSPITSLPSKQEINIEAKEFLNTKEHNKVNSNVDIFETGIYLPEERETSAVIKVNTSVQNSTFEANFPINSYAKIPQFGLFASREFKLDDIHSFSSLSAPTCLLAKPGFTEASTFPRTGKACSTAFNDGDNPNENHQLQMNENDAQQMKANDISLLDCKPFMDNLIFLSPIKDKLSCSISETGQNTTSLEDNVELLDAKETLATPKHAFMELPVVNNASDMSPKFESISNDVFIKNKRHEKSKKLPSEVDENKTNFISNYSEPQNEENVNKDTARKSPLSDRDPGFINAFSSEIDSDFETNLVIAEEIEIPSPNTISEINSNNSTAHKKIVSNTSDPIHLAFNNVDKLKIKDSNYELYRDNLFIVLTNPLIVPNIRYLIRRLVAYLSESKRSPMMSFLKNSDSNVLLPASEKCIVEVLFLIHQKNIPHLDKLLCCTVEAFHMIVIGKLEYEITSLSSFCRVITAICRLLKNREKPRRLCNDLIKYGYFDGPFLIASIVSVWKEAFKVSDRCTVEEKLFLDALAVISKSKPKVSTSKGKKKLSDHQWKTCFDILQLFLNCEIKNKVMDSICYLKMLIDQKYKKDIYDKAYLVTGSLMMYSRIQGFTWSHEHLLEEFINPNLNLYSNKEPNELAFQFFAYLYADIFHPFDNCKDVYSSYMRHEREFVHFYAGTGLLKLCCLRKDDLTDELMEFIEKYSQDARLLYAKKYLILRVVNDLKL